jgi:hypothetical protein
MVGLNTGMRSLVANLQQVQQVVSQTSWQNHAWDEGHLNWIVLFSFTLDVCRSPSLLSGL